MVYWEYILLLNKYSNLGTNGIQTPIDWGMSHNCQKSLYWEYVCKKNPLPHPEISAIPVQLYQKNNLLRQKLDKCIVNTQIFQGSRLGKAPFSPLLTLHKKWSFPLRFPSVNVDKSVGIWGFGKIYWRNP